MLDIARVEAVMFHRSMATGRTRPSLFTCRLEGGRLERYIVKFRSQLQARLVCELLAGALGRFLGLQIPPVAVVDIGQRLTSSITDGDVRQLLASDGGPHFGSQLVTGGKTVLAVDAPLLAATDQAVDLFAWDMLIQNPDRSNRAGQGNVNLLTDGESIVPIDHELAFSFVGLLGPQPDPWQLRGVGLAEKHIFYHPLRKYARRRQLSFDRFLDRLAGLSDAALDELMSVLPVEWDYPGYIEKIRLHLVTVRDNIDRFRRGLLEVFVE